MFDLLFKNKSLAVKFVMSLSAILLIGCAAALVLLQFRQDMIIKALNNGILESFTTANVTVNSQLIEQLEQNTYTVVSSFVFELNLVMIGIAIFVIGAVYTIFLYLIRHRLADLAARFRDVTEGDGDLTRRVPLKGNDGIDKLGHYFNNLLQKLHETISQVVATANQVTSASFNAAKSTQKTSSNIMQQGAETDQVAHAMSQMTATVLNVADNANNAAAAAQQAQSESLEGKRTVEGTINAINALADEVTQANVVIKQLQSDSENIGTVLDVIRAIAEQTNLLALNAAIEAARAGEQGRGFAVVADEVRTLASRTQQSTEEIQKMIQKLQEGANNAASVMESGHSRAQESVDQASKAGSALDKITQAVISISEMNSTIASAANEQQHVVSDMDQKLSAISQSANSTANTTQQTMHEMNELSEMAEDLQKLLSQFKL